MRGHQVLFYHIDDGALFEDGAHIGTCYSGHAEGRNNAGMEAVPNVGPIPRGRWHIEQPPHDDPKLGPIVFNLTPVGHDAHGRSAFRIHGDNSTNDASHGCIVMPRVLRQKIASEKLVELQVV